MVANPATHQKLGCKQGASLHLQRAAACSSGALPHDDPMLYFTSSWPLDLQVDLHHPNIINSGKVAALAPHHVSGSPLSSHAHHRYRQQRPYFLSFHPQPSRSRSAISSFTLADTTPTSTSSQSQASSSSPPAASHPIQQFTSLWDGEDEDALGKDTAQQQLPPLDPCDRMKVLLTQLGSCISSITTAYAHQQTALHSHNLQAAIDGEGGRPTMADVSTTDKAMVEALGSLSRLHSQLVLLPHELPFKEFGADGGHVEGKDRSTITTTLQLRRYEGIITRFHDEIGKKNAVTEALKETLAKSMLQGEKLQRRVKALEATVHMNPDRFQ